MDIEVQSYYEKLNYTLHSLNVKGLDTIYWVLG